MTQKFQIGLWFLKRCNRWMAWKSSVQKKSSNKLWKFLVVDRQDCKFSLNTIRSGAESLGPTVSNVEHESPILLQTAYESRWANGGDFTSITVLYNKIPGLMIQLMFVQDIFFQRKGEGD